MKKIALILVLVTIGILLCTVFSFAEPIIPVTEQAEATETAVPVGISIPKSIVIAIVVGAAAIGAFGGYYYARKRK